MSRPAFQMTDEELAERIDYIKFMRDRGVWKFFEKQELDECLREQAERAYKKERP